MLPAHNVVYLVRRIRIVVMQQTVFAAEVRPLGYKRS